MRKETRQKLDAVLWILGLIALGLLVYGIMKIII